MAALALSLLRPPRRTTRAIAALVVLALVGWLGVAASHLHVPGPAEADAHVHDGPHGAAAGHDDAHHPAGERGHPCSLCLSADRGAGPAVPPAIVLALAPLVFEVPGPDEPVFSLASPAVYRSRAPPAA